MALPDPRFAPQRADLVFLRKRVKPRVEPEPEPTAPPARGIDYTRHASARSASAPPASAPPASARPTSAPASAPSRPIDYTRHASARPANTAEPTPPSQLPPLERTVTPLPEPPPAWAQRHVVRVGAGAQRIMTADHPTVTLTRVQSGVGELDLSAMVSPSVGDLRLAAVYQLRSGGSGVVAHADGHRFGPSARRPVVVGSRDEQYEHLGIDLRQVTDVERVAIVAYSESRSELLWAGTLVVVLAGGARLEMPLDGLASGRIAVLATLYNMAGELVVRAELDVVDGDIREAARAYGFDRITWRDDRHPVD